MSWFHQHELELVGKTYAAPSSRAIEVELRASLEVYRIMERLMTGSTTFVWKCKDPQCNKIIVKECLGKEILND
jgi:hypothetical protein